MATVVVCGFIIIPGSPVPLVVVMRLGGRESMGGNKSLAHNAPHGPHSMHAPAFTKTAMHDESEGDTGASDAQELEHARVVEPLT